MHRNDLSPITSFKIYKSIVMPRALFGCEMLQSLSDRDNLNVNRSRGLCLKQIQGLKSRWRTDIVLGLLGVLPLQTEIDKRKLTFLGQLCPLERDCQQKSIFSSAFMFMQ